MTTHTITKEELIEKLLTAVESAAVDYLDEAQYGDMSGMHQNALLESVTDIADLFEQIRDESPHVNQFPLTFNNGDRYVVIDEAIDGEGYMYDVYESKAAYEADEDSVDGGQCTGSLSDAIGMALN